MPDATQQQSASCIYEGLVHHRRREPIEHSFRYPLFMMFLDLDELPRLFNNRWLWGYESRTAAVFRRSDHFGDPNVPLAQCVRELVTEKTGSAPGGPIRMLAHLRYFDHGVRFQLFYRRILEHARRIGVYRPGRPPRPEPGARPPLAARARAAPGPVQLELFPG